MPAVSKAQRIAMAIALHHPSSLYKRNAALLGMKHEDLEEFASGSTKDLPAHVHAMIERMKKKKKGKS